MKQVTKGQWGGYDTYILHSRELEVTLLPRLGNNVISLWDRKEERQILRTPDESDLAYYMQKPYHFGIPLLVPPGRIRKGQFRFGGASYQFEQNSAGDHHIHGLHRTQSWCVSDIEEDEDGCAVTTEFNTADDPGWMAQFPCTAAYGDDVQAAGCQAAADTEGNPSGRYNDLLSGSATTPGS